MVFRFIVLICGLLAAARSIFAMGDAVTAGVGAGSNVDPVDAVFGTLILVSVAGGMPHPDLWGTMSFFQFMYLWAYNSANNLCQNMGKSTSHSKESSILTQDRDGNTIIRGKKEIQVVAEPAASPTPTAAAG